MDCVYQSNSENYLDYRAFKKQTVAEDSIAMWTRCLIVNIYRQCFYTSPDCSSQPPLQEVADNKGIPSCELSWKGKCFEKKWQNIIFVVCKAA